MENEIKTSQFACKTDIGSGLFMNSHYLVRWSIRYSFEWKVKPQSSHSAGKIDSKILYFSNPFIWSDEALYDLTNEKWTHKHHNLHAKWISEILYS